MQERGSFCCVTRNPFGAITGKKKKIWPSHANGSAAAACEALLAAGAFRTAPLVSGGCKERFPRLGGRSGGGGEAQDPEAGGAGPAALGQRGAAARPFLLCLPRESVSLASVRSRRVSHPARSFPSHGYLGPGRRHKSVRRQKSACLLGFLGGHCG